MSVINKTPLINEILSGLSSEQLSDLRTCINGQGPAPIFRSLKPISDQHLTTDDYGVKPIHLELRTLLGGMSVYEGYLIYTAEMCYVICYSGDTNQILSVLKVDVAKNDAQFVNGALSILELRSELDDELTAEGGGGSDDAISFTTVDARVEGTQNTTVKQVYDAYVEAGSPTDFVKVKYNYYGGTIEKSYLYLSISKYSNYYVSATTMDASKYLDENAGADDLWHHLKGRKITVDDITSWKPVEGNASSGKVLTADGDGGAAWAAIPAQDDEVIAYEGTSLLPTDVVFENWTLHRAIKDGNILWIVGTGVIKNNSDSMAYVAGLFNITLPTEISSKIYRKDGTTTNNAYSSSGDIAYIIGIKDTNTVRYTLSANTINVIEIYSSSISLASAGTVEFDFRFPIFLDIGTVQS